MNEAVPLKSLKAQPLHLPEHRDAFYGGKWHKAKSGRAADAINPGPVNRSARRRLRRGRYRGRGQRRQGGISGLARYAAARARADAQAHRQCAARACRGTGADRRRRLRQSVRRNGQRRHDRGGADRVLRRPRHRDERLVDPDGARRGEFLGARAARRGRPHHSVQSSLHVLRRQIRRAARRRQHRGDEAAGAGAAVVAAACRTDRRYSAARRVQPRARRPRSRLGARLAQGRRHDRADRLGADRPRGDESRLRHAQGGDAGARRQERADRLSGRRSGRSRRRRHRRHELHLVRAVLRLDQPRLHPRENLRSRARQGEDQDRALQARHRHRSGDHHGLDHLQDAVRAHPGLYRQRQAGRRAASHRRRPAGRPGARQRLLHRADGVSPTCSRTCASRARRFSGPCSPSSNGATKPKCSNRSTPSNTA